MCLRIYCNRFFLVTSLLVFLSSISFAQSETDPDSTCAPQKDLPQLIREALKKPPKEVKKSSSLLLVPIIGSNPATGFMFGVGGQYAFQMKGSSQYSTISGSVQGITKSQLLVLLKIMFIQKMTSSFIREIGGFKFFLRILMV